MTNLDLGITPATAASPARLRGDGIQTAALIAIGRVFIEDPDRARRLVDALEDLGKVSYDPADGELDGALGDVLDLAYLPTAAEMDLRPADVQQLAEQAAAAAAPTAPVVRLPQRGGEAA